MFPVSLPHYTSPRFLAEAVARYRRFLVLKATYPDEFFTPCYDFDLCWHAHQAHPLSYKQSVVVFFFLLRFTATRYWMPLLPLLLLYFQSFLHIRKPMRLFVMGSGVLSVLLCLDDWEFAQGHKRIATEIDALQLEGTRALAGHWGLQWHLEELGFEPVEDDQPVGVDFVVHSTSAWPQEGSRGKYVLVQQWKHSNLVWGPTVYSEGMTSHFHANMIAPDVLTYASWGFLGGDFDHITLWKQCPDPCTGCIWDIGDGFVGCGE